MKLFKMHFRKRQNCHKRITISWRAKSLCNLSFICVSNAYASSQWYITYGTNILVRYLWHLLLWLFRPSTHNKCEFAFGELMPPIKTEEDVNGERGPANAWMFLIVTRTEDVLIGHKFPSRKRCQICNSAASATAEKEMGGERARMQTRKTIGNEVFPLLSIFFLRSLFVAVNWCQELDLNVCAPVCVLLNSVHFDEWKNFPVNAVIEKNSLENWDHIAEKTEKTAKVQNAIWYCTCAQPEVMREQQKKKFFFYHRNRYNQNSIRFFLCHRLCLRHYGRRILAFITFCFVPILFFRLRLFTELHFSHSVRFSQFTITCSVSFALT